MRTLLTLFFALLWLSAEACSSAVVARNHSKEAGVILWKHRDQSSINDCRIAHYNDGKYAYTALVHSYIRIGDSTLAGVNECGFGYVSTATSRLKRQPKEVHPASKQQLMCRALRECRTVEEFEALLAVHKRYPSFEMNVCVGDAEGGAAVFEIWADGYRKYDVTSFDVRTNFSFAATSDKRGGSVRRYETVMEQMQGRNDFTAQDFFGYSRSFYSAQKGDILKSESRYHDNNYTVPRYTSVASVVIVCSENPRIDAIVGHPVAGMSVPVWVAAGHNIPKCVAGRAMYDLGRAFKAKAYTQEGKKVYLNKEVARKVVAVNHNIKAPRRMPTNIVKFNTKVDLIFEKHRQQIMKILE